MTGLPSAADLDAVAAKQVAATRTAGEWMSVRDAAAYLLCCERSIHNLVAAGRLTGWQSMRKGKWRISRASVENLGK